MTRAKTPLARLLPVLALGTALAMLALELPLRDDLQLVGFAAAIVGLLAARWWALLFVVVPAAAVFVLAPRERDGSSEGPFIAGGMVPALALMAIAIAGRKLLRALRADASKPDSLAEALLGRPPAPEPAFELQSDGRSLVWFACLFGLMLAGTAVAASAGVDMPAASVVVAGVVALGVAFALPPRRRRVAVVAILMLAVLPAVGVAALLGWLLVAQFGCAEDAYECPV